MRTAPPERFPAPESRRQVTDALVALRDGAPDAMERLMPLVYAELRRIAHRQLRAERAEHTLSTTALVHEAYLKLVDQAGAEWRDRQQFFAVAARAMRRILVDYARRHRALRRGGARQRVSLAALSVTGAEDAHALATARADELLALDEALERLSRLDARLTAIVEYRFFVGLTTDEIAAMLGVTPRTVERGWAKARGWLALELGNGDA